jgi:hypothetical protein
MDRSLWLLMELRFRSWLRRLKQGLFTVRGALVALLCVLTLAPSVVAYFISLVGKTAPATAEHTEEIRRIVPLVLLVLCVGNIIGAAGEQAIAFSPAEVNLLFSGPFSRRQLLAYKLIINFFLLLAVALVMTICFSPFAPLIGAAFVGLVLGLMFLHLFLMTVVLIGSMIGAKAFNRRRRLVLGILVALGALVLLHIGSGFFELSPKELVDRAEQTPALVAVLTPFRLYVNAFTATTYWPDLAQWAGPGLALDLVLLGIVFALDAHYLEASANAGERIYANLQRIRSGGLAGAFHGRSVLARFRLPDLPWWGGIGPIAWRQLTAAPRSQAVTGYVLLLAVILVIPFIGSQKVGSGDPMLAPLTVGFLAWISFLLSPMITFDFRSDLDRMDVLKTLPIRSTSIAFGQLLAPVLIVSLVQWLILVILIFLGHRLDLLLGAMVFALPTNFLLFGLDNLLFLLYPTPMVWGTAGNFQTMGRNMLLMMGKFLILGFIGGLTGLACGIVYLMLEFIKGPSLLATLATAWLILSGFAIGVVPLVACAFRRFDVARDTPP